MSIRTPYGLAINLGTEAEPNLGGPAAAVGYARGVLDALAAVRDTAVAADRAHVLESIARLLK